VFLIFCAVAVASGAAMVQCDVVNAFVQALLSDHPGIPHTYMPVPQHTRHIYGAAPTTPAEAVQGAPQ
jgi:hypothetical protein